jgi:hypothetical protein
MLVTFDTLEYVKELKESGFSEEQADGLARGAFLFTWIIYCL